MLYDGEAFGGTPMITPGYDLLLQRLCYLYHSFEPDRSRENFNQESVLREAAKEKATPPTGGRQWWKIPKNGSYYYVCLNPPGHRNKPPEEPDATIEELPPGMETRDLRTITERALADRVRLQLPDHPEVDPLLAGVKSAIETGKSRDVPGFIARMKHHAEMTLSGYAPEVDRIKANSVLYRESLLDVEVDCEYFSAAIALLDLQLQMNVRLPDDVYQSPLRVLQAVTRMGQTSYASFDACGKHHLALGKLWVGDALKMGCLWNFQRALYLAQHHFSIAHYIASNCPVSLSYSAIVAEESLVCAHTGLTAGLTLYYLSPTKMAFDLAEALGSGEQDAADDFLHKYSSPFCPAMPRPYAKMAIGLAKLLATVPGTARMDGLQEIMDGAGDTTQGTLHGRRMLVYIRDLYCLTAAIRHEWQDLVPAMSQNIRAQLDFSPEKILKAENAAEEREASASL